MYVRFFCGDVDWYIGSITCLEEKEMLARREVASALFYNSYLGYWHGWLQKSYEAKKQSFDFFQTAKYIYSTNMYLSCKIETFLEKM